MSQFVFYLRTEEGYFERLGNMILIGPDALLDSYQYEEHLIDFPETSIFWARDEGASVGIARLATSP